MNLFNLFRRRKYPAVHLYEYHTAFVLDTGEVLAEQNIVKAREGAFGITLAIQEDIIRRYPNIVKMETAFIGSTKDSVN